MNTWSPQTMGVPPLQAGSSTFQTTPTLALHSEGISVAGLTPVCSGPRHCGQFEDADPGAASASTKQARTIRMKSRLSSFLAAVDSGGQVAK